MSGGTRIIAIGAGSNDAAADEFLLTQEFEPPAPADTGYAEGADWDDTPEEEPRGLRTGWILPALAGLAAAGWTAFYGWANWASLSAGMAPAAWSAAAAAWATPVLLIGIAWLLALRHSRHEARRFGDVARLLSEQSQLLETRLITVNRELSLAREFIAAQSRDLDALGRIAVERLSVHADRLQGLIHENGTRLDAIGNVSEAALDNMERLRGQLPVIASSAKDVTNNIGHAGRAALAQIEQMTESFGRVDAISQTSEARIEALSARVTATGEEIACRSADLDAAMRRQSEELAEMSEALRARLSQDENEALAAMQVRAAALAYEIETARNTLESREGEALVSLRARISALHDESAAVSRALRDSESRAGAVWRETVETLSTRLGELDADIAARHTAQDERTQAIAAGARDIVTMLADLENRLDAIAASTSRAGETLAGNAERLTGNLARSRDEFSAVGAQLEVLTDGSVRLLELIRASAQHGRDDLPAALSAGENRLAQLEQRIDGVRGSIGEAHGRGEALAEVLAQSRDRLGHLAGDVETMHARLVQTGSAHAGLLERLHRSLSELDAESAALSARASGTLSSAIVELSNTARKAVSDLADSGAPIIAELARQLSEQSAAAIDKAVRESASEAAGKLQQAATHAAGVGREAAMQLRDQLGKVNELAGNLERRVAQARERAEEQVDNDFARRAALITESLNSNAIDIAKALSTDVTDVSWAAYLRGDRGIFTRRAVSLLDGSEARAISQIYESDRDFRDHVSRYIHDFEAILRQVLSTRDGHALGVTLLSSDMGKLYVALAQGIERLRS
jgi:hypothetical protein